MASDGTHGLVVQGAGSTGAAETLIGSVELPTRGQPWSLHGLSGQVVRATATAAEAVVGNMRMNSASGDITPDPAPSRWPLSSSGSFLGSVADIPVCPLHKYDLDLLAAGKANVDLLGVVGIAVTVGPRFCIGIQFGPAPPAVRRFKFCDRVRATQTAVARTQIGTIQLSEKATRITGIMGYIRQDGVLVTAEELQGFFDLASDDVDLVPSQWQFNETFGAGLSTTIASSQVTMPQPHVVDIPAPGGARIDCFVTLGTAVTNGTDVEIFIMYE